MTFRISTTDRPFHDLLLRSLRFRTRRALRPLRGPAGRSRAAGAPRADLAGRVDAGGQARCAVGSSTGEPACAGTPVGPVPKGYSRSLRQTPSEPCS